MKKLTNNSKIVQHGPGEKSEVLICYITCPSEEQAELLASKVVEKDLCACVNIVPKVKSVYKW